VACIASLSAEIREKPNPSQSEWLEREPTGRGWFRCTAHGIDAHGALAEVKRLARDHAGF